MNDGMVECVDERKNAWMDKCIVDESLFPNSNFMGYEIEKRDKRESKIRAIN